MAINECHICQAGIPNTSVFCPSCGTRSPHSIIEVAPTRMRLSNSRLILLSILSSQLYIFFWMYSTWKQLAAETGEQHYPIWHSLSLLVPIYGWFRIFKHTKVIRTLAATTGSEPFMEPALVVVLIILSSLLGASSLGITNSVAIVIITIIQAVLLIAAITWPQADLNRYWAKTRPSAVGEAPFTLPELMITVVGLILAIVQWTSFFSTSTPSF